MTPGDQTPAPRGKGKFRETVEALAIALVLALIIRTFVVQAFKIPSGSMEDTLLIGDHLLVNKFLYGVQNPLTGERYLPIRQPQRGDIIVFEYPEDSQNSELYFWQRRDYIKRIIGLPGDTVELRNKQVFVNGELFRIDQEVHK
jgi:signal peptidase I